MQIRFIISSGFPSENPEQRCFNSIRNPRVSDSSEYPFAFSAKDLPAGRQVAAPAG
ncbi:MAG: hypothetical protein WC716_09040 [Chitinophagaceae bacterium]